MLDVEPEEGDGELVSNIAAFMVPKEQMHEVAEEEATARAGPMLLLTSLVLSREWGYG